MVVRQWDERPSRYAGMRMTADEYLSLPEDRESRYELVDGVVTVTPSPMFGHQQIAAEIERQLGNFLLENPTGGVAHEVDVKLGDDLVYCPDVLYVKGTLTDPFKRLTTPPNLVVEIASPSSGEYDAETKRRNYEAAGVSEYWLIDPARRAFRFLVLEGGVYREVNASGDRYASSVLPGFELDLTLIRRFF